MTEPPYPRQHQLTAGAGAAFTCDFAIAQNVSPQDLVALIERDRTVMTARPGFLRKVIPLRIDPASGQVPSGGAPSWRPRAASSMAQLAPAAWTGGRPPRVIA